MYLNQTGNGLLTLSGTADNSGLRLIVSGGTAVLAKSSDANHHAVAYIYGVAPGALLQMGIRQRQHQIYPTGGSVFGMNGTLDFNGQSESFDQLSGSGTVTNNAASSSATMTLGTDNGSNTFSGVIQDGGPGMVMALTKGGTGVLTLGGTGAFSGNTLISSGTLALTNSAALAMSTLSTNGSGVLNFAGGLTLAMLGGLTGSNNLALKNTASAAVALSVGNNAANTSYTGWLSGSGSLIKVGAGSLYVSGSNSYTGTTTVSAGALELGQTGSLYGGKTASWTKTNVVVQNGATLALAVGGATQFSASNVSTLVGLSTSGTNGFENGSSLGLDTSGGTFAYASASEPQRRRIRSHWSSWAAIR